MNKAMFVTGQQPLDQPIDGAPFAVQGEVVRPDGTPLPNQVVRALDRAICEWRLLGEAKTNDLGLYVITYDPAQLKQWGKTAADLKVEVRDATADTVLAESPLILRALPKETVNLSIGQQRYRGPDEYTRVERALTPLLAGHSDLSCIEVADVLILAREARLAGANVAYYVKARRWADRFEAPAATFEALAAMFYGLMRRSESTRIDALLARPLARLWERLEEARSRNLISLQLNAATRAQLAEIQQRYLAHADHPYARLLGTTALSGEQRAVFTQRLTAGDLSGDALWQALETESGFSAAQIADLQATFELQSFSGENTSLTVRLRGDLAVRAPREVAAFSVAQWRDAVLDSAAVEIPDEVLPDGPAAERRAAYAQLLYRTAELRYPTASLAGQLARDPLPEQTALQGFFAAHPDFEFRDQRVLNFLRERPQALEGLPETARDELLRLEQLFHLTPGEDKLATIRPLWTAGLRSAPQITYLGRGHLTRRLGAAFDAEVARRIYRKAVHVTALALNVYLRFHPRLNRLSLAALRMPQLSTDPALARSAITMPEWEELFGSPDACAVAHCESALSPAAYLVDTLAFLERAVNADGNNALDELLARRPDLGMLRLTCENTETPLPQIDLVIEILEAIVASADGKTLPGTAIGETTWDSELLAAQPEYFQPAAYDIVRAARYPFDHLPFDLWGAESWRYLRQMGIARDELMRAMPLKPGVGDLEIATEALGMSGVERDLIRRPDPRPSELALSWGFTQPAQLGAARLGRVANLLQRARIDYATLLRLLNTRYLNPERRIAIRFDGAPCAVDDAVLIADDGNPLADQPLLAFLDRLHRFLRLRRRLACTEYELDALIHALGAVDFNAPRLLPKIADAQALRYTFGLSLGKLGAWWADFDTYAYEEELPSQYEAIFLDAARFPDTHTGPGPDLRNQVFALRADRADLAITTATDAGLSRWLAESDGAAAPTYTLQPDYAAYLQSATQLTSDDLLLLARELLPKDAATGHVALNLAAVSLLYRVASLAQALKISVTDLLRLMAITGLSPLRTPSAVASPIESRRFHDRFREIDAGKHTIEELAYLLLCEPAAVATLAPTTADIDAWLISISPGFAGILAVDDERITEELKDSLTQSLGAALSIDAALLDAVLFTHRVGLGDELLAHVIVAANPDASGLPAPQRDFAAVFGQLHRFGLAWNGLALDQSFLPFVLDQGPGLGWADLTAFPTTPQPTAVFEPWRRLVAAAGLQALTFTLDQSLFGLLTDAAAQTADPASFVLSDFLAQISAWTGWPLADVTYLTGPNGFNLTLPTAMRDEQALIDLKRVFDLIRTKGVTAEQAHAWTVAELTFAETQAIKQTLSLAFSHDSWLAILGSIQDELRSLKRDALLDHLLVTLRLDDSDAFYRHYLIDPDEAPCGRTSRIVEAHAAVQLFVQRILLNLEPFTFERLDAEAWQWRKNYRVWEAARKVFLWPENWLEPELRDNKSAFFKELEDGLLQTEVTHESAERLYLEYLHKVDAVSQLEIMGMYREDETAVQPAVLHVFGRTRDVSHQYFYRRWEDQARWTPWEPVELDINADHLIPVVSNARLYLFWPEFTQSDNPDAGKITTKVVEIDPERADELRALSAAHQKRIDEIDALLDIPNFKGDRASLEAERATHVADIAALKADLDALTEEKVEVGDKYRMEVTLKWSEYRDGRWMAAAISKDKLSYTTSDRLSRHYFTGWVDTDHVLRISARINLMGSGEGIEAPQSPEGYIGYFYFDACGGNLVGSSVAVTDPVGDVQVAGALADFHAAAWYDTWWSSDTFELEIGPTAEKRLLLTSPGHLYYAHQDGQFGKELSPFFFSDGVRTYFVRPVSSFLLPELVGFSSTTAQRRGAPTSNGAPTARQIGVRRTIAGSAHLAQGTFQHFEASDSALIMDRGGAALLTSSLPATLGTLIEADLAPTIIAGSEILATTLRYRFTRFYHPHTCLFLKQQHRYGIDGLLDPDPTWGADSAELQRQLLPSHNFDFAATYKPNLVWVDDNFDSEQLDEQIDFDHGSPYGSYNWELFFHAPLLIATRLMQNQRYAEARQWFHAIFDPTATDGTGPARFWKIKPFYEEQLNGPLETLEQLLAEGSVAYEQQVSEWELEPFDPHVLARLRISAYMQATVMRYLGCLSQAADMLFRRDTREDINEARQLYLLAAEILGEQPNLLPAQETAALTSNLLLGRFRLEWNGLAGGNPLDLLASRLSTTLPGTASARSGARVSSAPLTVDPLAAPVLSGTASMPAQSGTSNVDTLLLFGIPHNEILYGYWGTVADRLFKIRHCMNLSGQVRQLALFAPPIDPALLVRASAMGLSIESILSSLFAPQSNYRFSFMLQKALELCGEARGLGGALLAALEKQDGEQIALLRSSHEVALLESIRALKKKSVEEADAALASLLKSRDSAAFRATYYASLERISAGEQKSIDKQEASRTWQVIAEVAETSASVSSLLPQTQVGFMAMGPISAFEFGGLHLASVLQAVASASRARAAGLAHQASMASTNAGYARRFKDWKHQADLARKEVEQLDQQILAAEIRKQVAESDLANHERQIAQVREVEAFLKLKFTNQQLYNWMVAKLASVHFQAYQLAYGLAVRAQAAFQHELGPDEQSATFVRPDNWDSLKKGLLAGKLLHQQLRQMEAAYLAANRREFEITKHVSLFQLAPAALLALRETGSCEIHIPEVLFDLDFAGHYYRRIKAVRITIPCVVGPYANVSATLTLTGSWTRRGIDLSDAAQPAGGTIISPQTVIATSSANQDGGAFELSFSDPRYLPFEGAGAISSWRLELPGTIRPFDYATISDVVMHVSYTARDGGPALKADVNAQLVSALNDLKSLVAEDATMSRLFSLRQEFPDAWHQLAQVSDGTTRGCTVHLSKQHFPSFLDHAWLTADNGTVQPKPITLEVKGLTAYLSPKGPVSTDAERITLNQQTATSAGLGIPTFDLTSAPGTLSSQSIGNHDVIACELAIDGSLRAEDWNDLYLLMEYGITT